MKVFLENKNDKRLTDLKKGLESLRLDEAAKYSAGNIVLVHPENLTQLPK